MQHETNHKHISM